MRTVGIILIIASSYLFARVLNRESAEKTNELYSLVSFLRYAYERGSCFFEPPLVTAESFSDPYLEGTGFLPSLRSGQGMTAAVSELLWKLDLEDGERTELRTLAEGLVTSSLDGYLRGLSALTSSAEKIYLERAERKDKRSRAVKISAVSAGLGLAILLV